MVSGLEPGNVRADPPHPTEVAEQARAGLVLRHFRMRPLNALRFDLSMAMGAAAMSASTIIVAANAQLLRRLHLNRAGSGIGIGRCAADRGVRSAARRPAIAGPHCCPAGKPEDVHERRPLLLRGRLFKVHGLGSSRVGSALSGDRAGPRPSVRGRWPHPAGRLSQGFVEVDFESPSPQARPSDRARGHAPTTREWSNAHLVGFPLASMPL